VNRRGTPGPIPVAAAIRRRPSRAGHWLRAAGAGFAAIAATIAYFALPAWGPARAFAPGSPDPAPAGTSQPAASAMPSVYYGVHVPGWLADLAHVDAFEAAAGKRAAIVMWYQGWGLTDGSERFQPAWMDGVRAHGSIPLVSWEPWLYTAGVNQPRYALRNIAAGAFDGYIAAWADASRAWGHPYFLRFAAEMNGDWFPWCEAANGNAPGDYVAAWRHVRDVFAREGATNVTWVWSPNVEYAGSTPLAGLYPGDAYVDWLAIDGYNWGTSRTGKAWQAFAEVFGPTYAAVARLSGKPLMISETASAEQGGDKAAWIADALGAQIPRAFPRIRAIVWFDEDKETDWRVASSPASRDAFAAAIASPVYAANGYASLAASPIPAP